MSDSPEITLGLLWQAVQDLKKDHPGIPLPHLIAKAREQLELCYYSLNRPPSLSREQFVAFQVDSFIYAYLSGPIAKAWASRDLVPLARAAAMITRNSRRAEALPRLREFVLSLPELDNRAWPPFAPAPEKLWEQWSKLGIPRPLVMTLKEDFLDYWEGVISLKARERGRKANKKTPQSP